MSVRDCSIDGETLKGYTSYWPPQRWQEYEPLLSYCRDNGVRLVACGTPLKVFYIFHMRNVHKTRISFDLFVYELYS